MGASLVSMYIYIYTCIRACESVFVCLCVHMALSFPAPGGRRPHSFQLPGLQVGRLPGSGANPGEARADGHVPENIQKQGFCV